MICARVSSKEQQKEGCLIPGQLKPLKDCAAAEGGTVAREYVDVEAARQTGRGAFGEMVTWLRAHPDALAKPDPAGGMTVGGLDWPLILGWRRIAALKEQAERRSPAGTGGTDRSTRESHRAAQARPLVG